MKIGSHKISDFTVYGDEAKCKVDTAIAHAQRIFANPTKLIFIYFLEKDIRILWMLFIKTCDFLWKLVERKLGS